MNTEENLTTCMGEIKADIRWIKDSLKDAEKKYAPMWVKYPVWAGTGGILFWTLNQLLALLPTVKALF